MIKILYGDSNDIPGAETNCHESSFRQTVCSVVLAQSVYTTLKQIFPNNTIRVRYPLINSFSCRILNVPSN